MHETRELLAGGDVAVDSWPLPPVRMVRRSRSFRGAIPHFGMASEGWRHVRSSSSFPQERPWTPRNWLLMFGGHYRVTHLRVMSVRRYATREEALADRY